MVLWSGSKSRINCSDLIVVTIFAQAESPELHEIDALCVLDFYVHESCQRQGIGKLLFEVSDGAVICCCLGLLQTDDDIYGMVPCGVEPCGVEPCGVEPCGVEPCGVEPQYKQLSFISHLCHPTACACSRGPLSCQPGVRPSLAQTPRVPQEALRPH